MTLPDVLRVSGDHPVTGSLRAPGDKSVSHRALLIGALAEGTSSVGGLSDGGDVARTLAAVRALGAAVRTLPDGRTAIEGGRHRLAQPPRPLDCGNSGTGLRLLAGLVAGLPWRTELAGDESLSGRPMDRIAEPLRAMGATVTGRGGRCLPPLTVDGGGLRGIDWAPPMTSAQVKSAVLFAGLSATGETVVRERVSSRAHTEEMLAAAGADVTVVARGEGREVRLRPSPLHPVDTTVPGDPSQAAFWLVAGCAGPGSTVVVEGVYAGPERLGFVGVLQRMGADLEVRPGQGDAADLAATFGPLAGTVVEAAEIPSLDEVPVLAVAAAGAEGTTVFKDVGELRVKESDRLAATVALVEAFGGAAHADGDDLVVRGIGPAGRLRPGRFHSGGDHRMAMAAAVAALVAGEGQSEVTGFASVATSYPGFLDHLLHLAPRALAPDAPAPPPPARRTGPLVAIDGPAGSGKSTVSRAVARRLALERLDTGAMYRAVAWAALDRGLDPADAGAVAAIAADAHLEVDDRAVHIDGREVTEEIRSPGVSRAVSIVAANPAVRRYLVERQRRWAGEHGGGVVEGRDIGTVVLPHADLKVYLDASPEERARRRHDETAEGLSRRDRIDSTRAASPLAVAEGALVLDTTGRSVEDVVDEVLSWL